MKVDRATVTNTLSALMKRMLLMIKTANLNFDVLLTVHLSIILAINQHNAQILLL